MELVFELRQSVPKIHVLTRMILHLDDLTLSDVMGRALA